VQDPEAVDEVEALVEPVQLEGVQAPVLDGRAQQAADRLKPSPPARSTPQRARTHSRYCSLSIAITRCAPRASARNA